MKKQIFVILHLSLSWGFAQGQITLDLSTKGGTIPITDIKATTIKLSNLLDLKKTNYIIDWKVERLKTPMFANASESSGESCSEEVKDVLSELKTAKDESEVKIGLEKAIKQMRAAPDDCLNALKQAISLHETDILIPFNLDFNQKITVTITRHDGENSQKKWEFILTTEEKTRWLVHYGLTYAPNLLSKPDLFFSKADNSVASKYIITKQNGNGPNAWDNISATMNFTYPFSNKQKDFDIGFTGGFGLSAGFELSGHAGLSAIIGENVILSSGFVMMPKYALKGEYKEGQEIKENLAFDSLHKKGWYPELYFTIGFRFGKNPFAAKSKPSTNESSKSGSSNTESN